MNLSDIAILNFKGFDYRCLISLISKNDAMNFFAKCWFDQKKPNIIKHKLLVSYITMGKKIVTFRDIEIEENFTAISLLVLGQCRYWESIRI